MNRLINHIIPNNNNLTDIDIKIIKGFLLSILAGLITSFLINYETTFKVIACVGGILYFFFIGMHLALCFPTILIFMFSEEYCEGFNLREKSYIVHNLLTLTIALLICFIVYFIIPLTLAMMWNVSFDFQKALKILQQF